MVAMRREKFVESDSTTVSLRGTLYVVDCPDHRGMIHLEHDGYEGCWSWLLPCWEAYLSVAYSRSQEDRSV